MTVKTTKENRRLERAVFLLCALLVSLPFFQEIVDAQTPPYPPSTFIVGINWDFSTRSTEAQGSDNWSITWADDGELYTAYGDGRGFDPKVSSKLSLGFAKVLGSPPNFSGVNIRSSSGEQMGNGASGKKASGMLMVDGTLYMWVRNADNNGKQCQLAWSNDHANTWAWNNWKFTELGYCAFLNYGQNYAAARDQYVYMYSPNTASAYVETDQVILTRVPKNKISDRNAYEFFKGLDTNGSSTWTSDISQRGSVFDFPGGSHRLDVTYNAPLGRYLMTMRSFAALAGGLNQFSIYDAPEPWGPWTTVYYTEQWQGSVLDKSNGGWGDAQHIPTKWISPDGKTFHLVFAGDDSFSVMKATLTVSLVSAPAVPTSLRTVQ